MSIDRQLSSLGDFEFLPQELIIHIASFLSGAELFAWLVSSKSMYKLFAIDPLQRAITEFGQRHSHLRFNEVPLMYGEVLYAKLQNQAYYNMPSNVRALFIAAKWRGVNAVLAAYDRLKKIPNSTERNNALATFVRECKEYQDKVLNKNIFECALMSESPATPEELTRIYKMISLKVSDRDYRLYWAIICNQREKVKKFINATNTKLVRFNPVMLALKFNRQAIAGDLISFLPAWLSFRHSPGQYTNFHVLVVDYIYNQVPFNLPKTNFEYTSGFFYAMGCRGNIEAIKNFIQNNPTVSIDKLLIIYGCRAAALHGQIAAFKYFLSLNTDNNFHISKIHYSGMSIPEEDKLFGECPSLVYTEQAVGFDAIRSGNLEIVKIFLDDYVALPKPPRSLLWEETKTKFIINKLLYFAFTLNQLGVVAYILEEQLKKLEKLGPQLLVELLRAAILLKDEIAINTIVTSIEKAEIGSFIICALYLLAQNNYLDLAKILMQKNIALLHLSPYVTLSKRDHTTNITASTVATVDQQIERNNTFSTLLRLAQELNSETNSTDFTWRIHLAVLWVDICDYSRQAANNNEVKNINNLFKELNNCNVDSGPVFEKVVDVLKSFFETCHESMISPSKLKPIVATALETLQQKIQPCPRKEARDQAASEALREMARQGNLFWMIENMAKIIFNIRQNQPK